MVISTAEFLENALVQTAKMASLGTIAGCVAHELNNPLAVICGNAQLLVKKAEEDGYPEEVKQGLASVLEYGTRASHIVRELLAFVRRPACGRELANPEDLIDATLVFLERELAGESITCKREYRLDGMTVEGNRNELQQVFFNLILNARDAMNGGGTLVVATRSRDEGEVEITFADTGHGIPEEIREKIFEPFFTTKPPGQGTGLGLAVCRQIVEAHGGSIRVSASGETGTVITVLLPGHGPEAGFNADSSSRR